MDITLLNMYLILCHSFRKIGETNTRQYARRIEQITHQNSEQLSRFNKYHNDAIYIISILVPIVLCRSKCCSHSPESTCHQLLLGNSSV